MKMIILNGSARRGNTYAAIQALKEGASEKHEVEVLDADKLKISPCKGCGACQCYKGCIDQDDTNPVTEKVAAADMIVFATPVYWWGMTAQLKQVIDKCYCRGMQIKGKKVGFIVTGGAPTDDPQYELIQKQFECMANYLSWTIVFQKSYSANAKDELANNSGIMEELKELGANL